MNPQKERFCLEYAQTGNATKSAIQAGYSIATARSQGQRLLTKADIQKRLKELAEETAQEKVAEISVVQAFWTDVLKDTKVRMTDRLKASELLVKSRGGFLIGTGRETEENTILGQYEGEDVVIYVPEKKERDQ